MAKAISRDNALKLSAWLAVHEPKLFRQLYSNTLAVARSPLGRLGYFGDDVGLSEITVNAGQDFSTPDFSSVDTSSFNPTVSLTDISYDPGSIPAISSDASNSITDAIAAPDVSSPVAAPDTSFWGSIASGASSVAGAVGKVASALASPQAITAAGNVASSYFKSQATATQAQMAQAQQQATVNAQLARVAQGYPPAPITYQRNPYTGQVTPVYQTSTGAYQPATPSVLSRLASPGVAGVSSTLLIGGSVAALILITLVSARK